MVFTLLPIVKGLATRIRITAIIISDLPVCANPSFMGDVYKLWCALKETQFLNPLRLHFIEKHVPMMDNPA
jgi:hypothetical protein